MLDWNEILRRSGEGNPVPPRKVEKSDEEWLQQLTAEQYHVTREHGTERAFSSEMCQLFEPGQYACICCGTLLFDSEEKFDSGTGWPSFTQPLESDVVKYRHDHSLGRSRIETLCNICDAHLGHVFPDGPEAQGGLRYCINAVALKKVSQHAKAEGESGEAAVNTATFGGGCFWCTEAIFQQIKGVHQVQSGYAGGDVENPSYKQVCTGQTGHAEVIQVTYDPAVVSFEQLVRVHLGTHDPTTLNQQGADRGPQYRSIIFYDSNYERDTAVRLIREFEETLGRKVVTEVVPAQTFYAAETEHQNYYERNKTQPYCAAVISPKLEKFRAAFPASS